MKGPTDQWNHLGPRARAWMAVHSEGMYGATYQDVARMLCPRRRVMTYGNWQTRGSRGGSGMTSRYSCALPARTVNGKSHPVFAGTYLSGLLYNMWKQGFLSISRRLGPRGGRVYVVTPKCKIPKEVKHLF